jgi:hypothetical protein
LGRRRRRSSLQRHVGPISRRQDHSRDLAARHRECRSDGAVADTEVLALRPHATVSSLRERRQLVANGRNCIVCGRCTRPDGTRCAGGGCDEQERSADYDLVQHLSSSLQAACWRRAGVRTDDANGYRQACSFDVMRGCTIAMASIASRYFQNSVVLRTDESEPESVTDHNHDHVTADGSCGTLRINQSGSSGILDCSPLLSAGRPRNPADDRMGQ